MLDIRNFICYTKEVEWRCGCSSMVESQPSKLIVRVRFPLPAPKEKNFRKEVFCVSDAVGVAAFSNHDNKFK